MGRDARYRQRHRHRAPATEFLRAITEMADAVRLAYEIADNALVQATRAYEAIEHLADQMIAQAPTEDPAAMKAGAHALRQASASQRDTLASSRERLVAFVAGFGAAQ